MKKTCAALLVVFSFLSFSSKGQGNLTGFLSIVKQGKMTFETPANMKETKVITNDELNYQYAVKDSVNNFEVRYLVYPLQDLVNKYNSPHPDTSEHNRIDPNFIHTNLLVMYSLKVQGKSFSSDVTFPDIQELPHATVEKEFYGDWAGEVHLQPCDEFGQKYKYCTILEIHKDNAADAFVMFLYNNADTFDEMVKPVFHNLKFSK